MSSQPSTSSHLSPFPLQRARYNLSYGWYKINVVRSDSYTDVTSYVFSFFLQHLVRYEVSSTIHRRRHPLSSLSFNHFFCLINKVLTSSYVWLFLSYPHDLIPHPINPLIFWSHFFWPYSPPSPPSPSVYTRITNSKMVRQRGLLIILFYIESEIPSFTVSRLSLLKTEEHPAGCTSLGP